MGAILEGIRWIGRGAESGVGGGPGCAGMAGGEREAALFDAASVIRHVVPLPVLGAIVLGFCLRHVK
jgi:hypothetical protein